MELSDLVGQVDGFIDLPPREKICLFAWWLHAHQNKEAFENYDIRRCYDQLHLVAPNVALYVPRMASGKSPDLVKVKGGYKLERAARTSLDAKYGVHHSVIQIDKMLTELTGRVPDL